MVRCALVALLIAASAACAKTPAASSPAHSGRSGASLDRLRAELAATFDTPTVHALWAVKVQSLDSGDVLFERNPHTLVMPASNMKILTMAVAAERLGWDHRFETTLETAAPIENGTLAGDLVVVGHGDPTISDRDGDRTRVFATWADRLRDQGVTRIAGRIVGDDDALDDRALGDGWSWDDLAAGYAAPGGALQFNENVLKVVVQARGEAGQGATVTLDPPNSGLSMTANVVIAASESSPDVVVWRWPFDTRLEVTGTVPRAERDYVRTVAVDNPTQFFVNALRDTLTAKGIIVEGAAVDIDDLPAPMAPGARSPRRVLLTHQSRPLSEIGVTFMKVSQNLFGETLLSTLGIQAGVAPCQPTATPATCRGRAVTAGRKVYETVLTGFGATPGAFIVSDGSGLSRYDYVTADLLVLVLRRMAREPRHAAVFEATLPIMGRDGTLNRRMRGTRAEGVVRAKTGSIANVRSLSGYLTTIDGERLVFSIVGNNYKAPSAAVDAVAEQAVERLVGFTRQETRSAAGR